MTNQLNCAMFTRFADCCRTKDSLPAEAKRTVEALLELIEWNYVWSIAIPQGDWMVLLQREYEPEGWRYVAD
ncbi:hypothetical protein [Floridanema aerugineum]|uniref:Uncharacterized protein n=1 Tax=Floridaenema aerugineum BLCC-F46 TaxID=3153654 RepID=A0ABV4WZM7_9CYAN